MNSLRGLRRSREDRLIGGVCGGIADWLDWNATLVRLLFVAISVSSAAFPGILVYLALWVLMPLRRRELEDWDEWEDAWQLERERARGESGYASEAAWEIEQARH